MLKSFSSFDEFADTYPNTIYRFWVYREQPDRDGFIYEDSECKFAKIVTTIDLGNGDWFLGLAIYDDSKKPLGAVEFYNLSKIHLEIFKDDNLKNEKDADDFNEVYEI